MLRAALLRLPLLEAEEEIRRDRPLPARHLLATKGLEVHELQSSDTPGVVVHLQSTSNRLAHPASRVLTSLWDSQLFGR